MGPTPAGPLGPAPTLTRLLCSPSQSNEDQCSGPLPPCWGFPGLPSPPGIQPYLRWWPPREKLTRFLILATGDMHASRERCEESCNKLSKVIVP